MIFKPDDNLPSLKDSIGSLEVGNKVFNFANDSYPVDAIARMSPESAIVMQVCDDVRSDAGGDLLTEIDVDHDMKITKKEFIAAHKLLPNAVDAFDFASSVLIQPEQMGKPKDESSIELGQFFHVNWGWREYLKTGGDISYPWRSIIENTIGPLGNESPENRVNAFKQANSILSNLFIALQNVRRYPSREKMEKRLIYCKTNDYVSDKITTCANQAFLAESGGPAYIPIGAGDGGAASSSSESIFDTRLAYPSQWTPGSDFYDSRLLKVAKCLVIDGTLSLSDALKSLGCDEALNDFPPIPPEVGSCAREHEHSKSCGFKRGKHTCCSGLVCHLLETWICVKGKQLGIPQLSKDRLYWINHQY